MSFILRPYQSDIISEARYSMKAGEKNILITAPTGCIAGDAYVRLNRAGKGFKRSLSKAYATQSRWNKAIKTSIRGLAENESKVSLVTLNDGFKDSGVLSCIKISTNNRSLTLTPEHLVYTKNGWDRADNLFGKLIAVDSPKPVVKKNKSKKKRDSYLCNVKYHPYASTVNSKRDGSYKKVEMHRAIYEAHINNISTYEYKYILRYDKEKSKNLSYMNPMTHVVHHIDHDHHNNNPLNLCCMTKADHLIHHSKDNIDNFGQGKIKWERVISVENAGLHRVYDAVNSQTNSFTANDIVVHNSGKTVLTASMIKSSFDKGLRSLFVVHRRELVKQSVAAFKRAGLDPGVIASGFEPSYDKQVQVASIQSLTRRFKHIKLPHLVVWDEVHHIASKTWSDIFKIFGSLSYQIGLTATPERLDGKGLSDFFNVMIEGPDMGWLIDNGFLSKYRVFAPTKPNLKGIQRTMGDYHKSSIEEVMISPNIIGSVVDEYEKYAAGKRNVIFAVSVKHSMKVVEMFNERGIPAAHVDGKSSSTLRDNTIAAFDRGDIKVLSNVGLFGEGFDLPAIECCTLLRPTQSLGLYLQMVGRALRIMEGKTEAIILDHTGNILRHGLPCQKRKWSLTGTPWKERKKEQEAGSVIICRSCFGAFKPAMKCPHCGFMMESQAGMPDTEDGKLQEIAIENINKDILKKKKMTEQGRAQTLEELYQLGIKRGYKNARGWAKHIFNSRQRKKVYGR